MDDLDDGYNVHVYKKIHGDNKLQVDDLDDGYNAHVYKKIHGGNKLQVDDLDVKTVYK